MGDLDGKKAIVTGAARGIGLAIARRLAAGGATVALTDVNGPGAEEAAASLGAGHVGFALDVTDAEAVQAGFERAHEELGGLDVVVNNAGIEIGKPLVETSTEEFRALLDINVIGVFHGIKSGAAMLGEGGVIINMSSVAGIAGVPLLGGYCASKAGVRRLSETAAVELAAAGLRVVAVCPAFVDTAMVDRLVPAVEAMTGVPFGALAEMKQGRLGEVEDVAEAVAFVASDDAGWSTGNSFVLDGGLTGSLL